LPDIYFPVPPSAENEGICPRKKFSIFSLCMVLIQMKRQFFKKPTIKGPLKGGNKGTKQRLSMGHVDIFFC